jgi:outer membrane lipoprotein-sorting protein
VTFAVLLLLAATPADLPATVKARLADAAVVRGAFEQDKQVKGFKRPLKSKGDFVVARGRGVRWHTTAPFESVLTVRKDDISSRQGDTEVFRLDASKEPTVRVINQVLFALLAGDIAVLQAHFEVEGSVDEKGWQLALTPKAKGLAQVMSRISLQGDRFVRRLELSEASGDTTVIRVEGASDGPPLTQAELAGW